MDSAICTYGTLKSPELQYWAKLYNHSHLVNRKVWEWCYIAQVLKERAMLRPGMRGLGFAVGLEPLTSCFASLGARVTATDLNPEAAEVAGWVQSSQHANNKALLNGLGLCEPQAFSDLVDFEFVNMNDIPAHYHEQYDFLWSSCALEHLGSLAHGERFIYESIKCLKRGGVAVHTTELNVSSNDDTLEDPNLVLYRRKDIERIIDGIRSRGCHIDINWDCGTEFYDYYVDVPPYRSDLHLKLRIMHYTVTSIGLLFVKL
jgi:2-polyprenyl-3-methyl-5-hydroxy-6-metoxy-1,4-benzoquinol methylase